MQKEAADKGPGAPSEPHCPCTGLLCLLFANKPRKAWPRNQLVPGRQAPGQPPRPGPVWPQHPLRAGDTSPTAPPLPPPGRVPAWEPPASAHRPSLFPVRGRGAWAGLTWRGRRLALPSPIPAPVETKENPSPLPEREETGWGWRLFRCFSGWNKLVVGEGS